ncbi:MAG: DUF4920 domain-containing protein [Planctomycetota bacterium]
MTTILRTATLACVAMLTASVAASAQQPGNAKTQGGAQEASSAKSAKLDATRYQHFGDGVLRATKLPQVSLAEVMANPTKFTKKKIRLEGPITGVCQAKGCWMNLGKPLPNGNPPVFVKFKDYAFFVPKDASGRDAIIEGMLSFKQETVAETRHYLEDAGRTEDAKKVTQGRKILRFMADGVAIEKPASFASWQQFGSGIKGSAKPLTLATVMANPTKFANKKIRLSGPITGVCQAKGCWMNLGKPLPNGNPPVFVKFKDYAFFVPKDASGSEAVVEGTLSYKQETVAETRHYLEDAGRTEDAKKVTQGRKILRFMADGVAIEPAKASKQGK